MVRSPAGVLTVDSMSLFVCGLMIVVDPELVRLPVLCGARLIVYISFETWHDDTPVPRVEEELAPCLLHKSSYNTRSQI